MHKHPDNEDRLMDNSFIWRVIAYELRHSLQVDSTDMGNSTDLRTFSKAASKVSFYESNSSKSGPKYGPGDKPDNYKTTRYSDKDSKHSRGHRGHGGPRSPSYTLVHIT